MGHYPKFQIADRVVLMTRPSGFSYSIHGPDVARRMAPGKRVLFLIASWRYDFNPEVLKLWSDIKDVKKKVLGRFKGVKPEEVERLTTAYQALLGPGWARHMATRREDPPPTPFAVDVGTTFIDMDLRYALPTEEEQELEKLVSSPGWIRASNVMDGWLLAGGGTESCTFEFELPDGQYRVSALAGGRGTIQLGAAGPRPVDLGEARLLPLEVGEEVALGLVEIQDRTFSVQLKPAAGAPWFFVRRFGFEPLEWKDDSDRETEERLRTLGYIQ